MMSAYRGLVAAAVLAFAAPVVAQDIVRYNPNATATTPRYRLTEAEQGRINFNAYAACLLEHDRDRVLRYLDTVPDSEAAGIAARRLAAAACLRYGDLGYTEEQLRGAVYIALVREAARRGSRVALQPVNYGGAGAVSPVTVAKREFADCLIRADPEMSRTVVVSPVGSEAEKVGYRALSSRYAGCLTQGSTAQLNRAAMAGLIAEALYRSAGAGAGR